MDPGPALTGRPGMTAHLPDFFTAPLAGMTASARLDDTVLAEGRDRRCVVA